MKQLIDYKETPYSLNVSVKRPTARYINEFIKLVCAPDLLALKLYPNAKEITESMAAYNAVRTHLKQFRLDDRSMQVIIVADGCTPRTAALFAHRTAWRCTAIDPNLRVDHLQWKRVQRLGLIRGRIEDQRFSCPAGAILVAVHSHAKLEHAVASVIDTPRFAVVSIPCCVPQQVEDSRLIHYMEYEDWGIWSPERTVKIWW